MSDEQAKGLAPVPGAMSKGGGFGKPKQEWREPRFAELDAQIAVEEQAEARTKAQRSTRRKEPRPKRSVPPLPREYREAVIRTAMEHRREFKAVFAADLTIRDRGARLYRSLLFPRRRGHRPTRRVLKAVSLVKKLGRKPKSSDWQRIDLECLPTLAGMPELERREQRRKLHHAVRTYLRRHRINRG